MNVTTVRQFWTDTSKAKSLKGKYERAVLHSKRTQDYIDQLEEEIKSSEVIGPALLEEWKQFEEKWLEDVVQMDKHENLENPYEIKVENREYILRAYESRADRDSIGLSREETMKILTVMRRFSICALHAHRAAQNEA